MSVQPRESGLNCSSEAYSPRPAAGFLPTRIVLAKGSNSSPARCRLSDAICAVYPRADIKQADPGVRKSTSLPDQNCLDMEEWGLLIETLEG